MHVTKFIVTTTSSSASKQQQQYYYCVDIYIQRRRSSLFLLSFSFVSFRFESDGGAFTPIRNTPTIGLDWRETLLFLLYIPKANVTNKYTDAIFLVSISRGQWGCALFCCSEWMLFLRDTRVFYFSTNRSKKFML